MPEPLQKTSEESAPAPLASLAIKMMVDCPSCPAQTPVPGLVPNVHCHRCHHVISIAWSRALPGPGRLSELLLGDQHEVIKGRAHIGNAVVNAKRPFSVSIRLKPPACQCGKHLELDPAALEAAARAGGTSCPKCARTVPVAAPSEAIRQLAGKLPVRYVISAPAEPTSQPKSELTLRCTNCGAPLAIKGHPQIVECEFCGASENVSSRLDGAERTPAWETFYLLFTPDWERALELKYAYAASAEDAAASARTPVRDLEFLAKSRHDAVRIAVAKNARTPEAVLIDLVTRDPELAGEAILERFRQQPGSEALEAALAPIRERHAPAPAQPEPAAPKPAPSVGRVVAWVLVALAAAAIIFWLTRPGL